MSYTMSFDDVTGEFSGSFTFVNYIDCYDKSEINGAMTSTGVFDLNALDFGTMKMTFTNLTYKEGTESMGLSGTMDMRTISALNYEMTMNIDFKDNVAGTTYRVKNFVVNILEDAGFTYSDINMNGDAYHPTYGYVTISTTTVVRQFNTDENPTSGVIVLTGISASKVTVTFTSNDTYTLDVDRDGDNVSDSTKNCTWSTNICI